MTREEMIQRLYEGNFTTGELERQLIAKLFEGGSGSSGGGGVFKVESYIDENRNALVLNKTAKEIMDAHETSTVFISLPDSGDYLEDRVITSFKTSTSTNIPKYRFEAINLTFGCMSLDDYPYYPRNSGDDGGAH